MPKGTLQKAETIRSSNIELLKIIAIIIIIFTHMNTTFIDKDYTHIESFKDHIIDLNAFKLMHPVKALFMNIFTNFGQLGNDIFFISSAWFLCDSEKKYGKKIVFLITEVWLVSLIILCITYMIPTVKLNGSTIARCIFPTTFYNSWYITSYIFFLIVLPYLIKVDTSLSRKAHLIFLLFFVVKVTFIDSFTREWISRTIGFNIDRWFVIFFIISYIKKYLYSFTSNIKTNILLLFFGIFIMNLIEIINTFNIKVPSLITILTFGWKNNKFYVFIIAFSLFNIFLNIRIDSKLINRISKQSLLIYVVHNSVLSRGYLIPLLLSNIPIDFIENHTLTMYIILTLIIFLCSLTISVILESTFVRFANSFVDKYYSNFDLFANRFLNKIIKKENESLKI